MAVASYLAKRSFTGGAVLDDPIVKNLTLADMEPSRSVDRTDAKSIGGQRETIYDFAENHWQCSFKPVVVGTTAELELLMFLNSIESGQVFSFAPYSESTDSPIGYTNVVIESNGWHASRVMKVGGATRGASDYLQYSFTLVEHP